MGGSNFLTRKSTFFLILGLFSLLLCYGEAPYVSIYDDTSDSNFGRSVSRGVIRAVRLDRFSHYRSLPVERELLEGKGFEGYLTPLVLDDQKKGRLEAGLYKGILSDGEGRFSLNRNGVDIVFSLEKPNEALYREIDAYYEEWPEWHEPVRNHYRDNWVIRIHRAENVFEPWIDRITYNEALLSAALIADEDQWLWGVHDGADILEKPLEQN
ncbi:MAG: hypothetical protein PQJ59_13385 [Spirochaetales bacterium]|nr:hypothetical protein [Spirochaetales bacterium]